MKTINFKKGSIVEIALTQHNLDRFNTNSEGKIIGKVIKNKGWSFGGIVEDPVDVQISKKVGKSREAVFAISRKEIKEINERN